MDWYLDACDRETVSALRVEVSSYLRRYAQEASDLGAAELVVGELLSNVYRHAGGRGWVSLEWDQRQPLLTVRDLGEGFQPTFDLPDDPLSPGGRGLYLANALVPKLEVAARTGGGSAVSAVLPVERPVEPDHDPPRRRSNPLPTLEEASPAGFGREPFLRALVVQLAMAVEEQHGPHAAEAAVAQVAADVGGQMEEEFRLARGIVGSMTPEQLGECWVGLKHAIDGGFRVVEASPQRVVLVNDRCPFGDVVQRAPSLCRMTSSVFGGIAARNTGEAGVVLEERIAVGDPGCRIVVHLGGPGPEHAHRYRSGS